jgi:hypothetical protein
VRAHHSYSTLIEPFTTGEEFYGMAIIAPCALVGWTFLSLLAVKASFGSRSCVAIRTERPGRLRGADLQW